MDRRSVHDNNVYAYLVDCAGRRIVMHTEYRGTGEPEFTDVVFSGVLAHHFADVMRGNILFDIEEIDVDRVVAEWASVFSARKKFGWPEGLVYSRPEELPALLRERNVNAYQIRSSYGLDCWVLAEAVGFRGRSARFSTEQ
jgi:hypothetical protein